MARAVEKHTKLLQCLLLLDLQKESTTMFSFIVFPGGDTYANSGKTSNFKFEPPSSKIHCFYSFLTGILRLFLIYDIGAEIWSSFHTANIMWSVELCCKNEIP